MAAEEQDKHFDIVVAGGGMVGASLALAIAPLGLRVAMVEPVARDASSQPSFDDRTTALSRSSQRMFAAMGLWEDIAPAATPVTRIHVSDRGRFGFSHIDAREQGVEALGHVVINRVLGNVLQGALAATGEPEILCPARIVGAETGPQRVRITVEGGGDTFGLSCSLLVAADGANSMVRDMVGIAAERVAYGQRAVIGNVLTEKPIGHCAYERFTEQGPLALLPMTENRAGFVWTVSEQDADRVLALDDPSFLDELQHQFGYRLGTLSRVGVRAAYPLVLSRALRLTAQRAVLIGNSAHGLHPVAAQGFNLGLRDVAALCDCIADALRGSGTPVDVGDGQLLQRYAKWRGSDQKKLVGFTDALVRVFGASAPPLRALRNLGMLGFDLVPGVRSLVARHTMGLAGRLPRLSRGVPLS